jgi:tetratricopeptide (TPR) repeat protein
LSADELELLSAGEERSGALGEELGAVQEHVQSCLACRRKLEVYPMSSAKLEKLRAPRATPKGSQCPSIETWLQVAGNLLPTAEQGRYLAHAAQCDHCGPILREIAKDFSHPLSQEEETLLSGIESNKEPWRQAQFNQPSARKTPSTSPRDSQLVSPPRTWSGFWRWAVPSAAVAACAVFTFVLIKANFFKRDDTLASVTQLLDKAYGERRITELRLPGGEYGPVRVSRSASNSQFAAPAALLKAQGKIAEALETQPNDSEFLRRKAEADLLVGNYSEGITTLNTIVNQGNPSSAVLQDLGTAYFESAEDSGSGESYERAFQYLSQALKIDPTNSEIFFNLAIVEERLQFLDQAIAHWEQFLKLEHDQHWIAEGREHLQAIEEKKKLAQ